MTAKITVAIPVGPETHHQEWLEECLHSVVNQTLPSEDIEILLIDDMADIHRGSVRFIDGMAEVDHVNGVPDLRVWKSPWRLGVAAAMNFGVALASHKLVFMLCADDMLHPECLARCLDAYGKVSEEHRDMTYFFVGVKYLDGREEDEQFVACGAAMVTKDLWRRNGGFPPESASGAPDAALISTMMVHEDAGRIVGVGEGMCLYNYRPHANSDSAGRQSWQSVILATRDLVTRNWKPPTWGRYG